MNLIGGQIFTFSLWVKQVSAGVSYVQQYKVDWLDEIGWDRRPPAPEPPPEVVRGTRDRYAEAYERITRRSFDDYLREGP